MTVHHHHRFLTVKILRRVNKILKETSATTENIKNTAGTSGHRVHLDTAVKPVVSAGSRMGNASSAVARFSKKEEPAMPFAVGVVLGPGIDRGAILMAPERSAAAWPRTQGEQQNSRLQDREGAPGETVTEAKRRASRPRKR
jgi:hypothetical protein